MDDLLMQYSKKHAPHMNMVYHRHTVKLMKEMIELAVKKREFRNKEVKK